MVTGPAHWELLQRARAMDNNGMYIILFWSGLFISHMIFIHHCSCMAGVLVFFMIQCFARRAVLLEMNHRMRYTQLGEGIKR